MMARFKGNMSRAKFFVNQSVLPYIYALQDPNGSYIWAPSAAAGSPGTLYGRPIVVTEKLPALGTTGDVLLADMGFYLIGDRAGMSVMTSEHFKFQNDQMAYRVTKRVDGQVWLDSAITPRAGGSTLSPFVGIG
jgi:HK97 family phage major capsid protein